MKPARASVLFLASILSGAAVGAGEVGQVFDFEADGEGQPPKGFSFARTAAEGKPGHWVVRSEPGAPSGKRALAQLDPDATDARYPMAIADKPSFRDGEVSVKCKAISGKVDQACGLVLRYRDENNYYITRMNALENNVRLYYVKDGRRKQLASWSGEVAPGKWHELRAVAVQDELVVYLDGKKVLATKDRTFTAAGRAGVWTKADSITYFDDLTVTPR